MRTRFDHDSPVPLYYQVVRAIEYRIATGDLRVGDRLPSLRDAAEEWGINLHTVRKGYVSLAHRGAVETRHGAGTVVCRSPHVREDPVENVDERRDWARDGSIHDFVDLMVQEGRERWGVSPVELGRMLQARASEGPVWVIECSGIQANDLAEQVRRRTGADARGWSLENPGDVPPGRVVATYFHYGDVGRRWPERCSDVHFVAIHPDPAVSQRVQTLVSRSGGPVLVCERGAAMASNVAADLASLLENVAPVETMVNRDPEAFLAGGPAHAPRVFAPRVWAELSDAARQDPRAIELRYVIDETDLEDLAEKLTVPTGASARAGSSA